MDFTNIDNRKKIIEELQSAENKRRKEEHLKRFEIYKERQLAFVNQMLLQSFSPQTVQDMRKISSVNLAKRIIDQLAACYQTTPERTFHISGQDISEIQEAQCFNLYEYANANVKFKKANKWYELHQQCAIQTIPRNGVIDLRVLAPHQYDVVPDETDPEKAQAYIINTFDRGQYLSSLGSSTRTNAFNNPSSYPTNNSYYSDRINQNVGDPDDYNATMQRFVWWTSEHNFITNGKGQVIVNGQPVVSPNYDEFIHDLGELPFDDVAKDKDFEFWVRAGNGITDFSIEFLALLSDVFNIHNMQGFAQAIIYSEKPPASLKIGPNNVLHIPLDPNKEVQPRFEFANPNPDMQASLQLLENFLRMFLSSRGIDPKSISGTSDANRFNSGIERLLSMIDKFEASRDSFDLFRYVEKSVFEKMKKWSNIMQTAVAPSETTPPLVPDLRLALIPEQTQLTIQFASPEIIQTKSEREDSAIKNMDAGLMSRSEAISFIRGIDEEKALEVLKKIDQEAILMAGNNNDEDQGKDQPEEDGADSQFN